MIILWGALPYFWTNPVAVNAVSIATVLLHVPHGLAMPEKLGTRVLWIAWSENRRLAYIGAKEHPVILPARCCLIRMEVVLLIWLRCGLFKGERSGALATSLKGLKAGLGRALLPPCHHAAGRLHIGLQCGRC